MKIFALIFLLTLNSIKAFSFVHTKTEYNRSLKWNDTESISLNINPSPIGNTTSNLSETQIKTIFEESIGEWNNLSNVNINFNYTNSLEQPGIENTVRFSDDPSYFGSGVLAVTSVNHSAATGEIYSADILINDTPSYYSGWLKFSANKTDTDSINAYLGDVVTHELGHFLGLGHSDVFGASMVYSVFKGQHTLHTDDHNGVEDIYGAYSKSGVISGRIIGGSDVGVFGAQVQAISVKDGVVLTGVLSDTEGNFQLKNLPTDDSYLVYVLPPRSIDHLPSYYASVQSRYCSGKEYVPSFFTKCGGRDKGKPQAINLSSSSSIDIGSITIKCDEGLRADYLYEKTKDSRSEVVIQQAFGENNISETFVGYFSKNEIADTTSASTDKLRIDLTGFNLPTNDQYYLDLKVITKEIGTGVKLTGGLTTYLGTYIDTYSYGNFNELNPDLSYQVPLSQVQTNNTFLLSLRADPASGTELNGIFSNNTTMINENSTYLVITTIKKYSNGAVETYSLKDSYPYEDNYYCTEGDISYTSKANVIGINANDSSRTSKNDEQAQALSCGTIDIDNNDGQGGMMSFALGLSLILLLDIFRRKSHDFFV